MELEKMSVEELRELNQNNKFHWSARFAAFDQRGEIEGHALAAPFSFSNVRRPP